MRRNRGKETCVRDDDDDDDDDTQNGSDFVAAYASEIPGQAYESVSKSFRTGRLERELQLQLSAIRCSCIASL
jgi:hypothetical protein